MERGEKSVLEAIQERRTCKEFSPDPVEFEEVAQIIQAGMHAPSSGGLQNWQFIIITDKEKLRALYNHTMEQDVFNTAPIGVIVCADNREVERRYGVRGKRLYSVQNCAACIQNMLLAADSFGLGATWIGAFDEEKVDLLFDIPAESRVQAILLFGHPIDEPLERRLKDLEHVTYFNKHGSRLKSPELMMRDYSEEWRKRARQAKERVGAAKTPAKEHVQQAASKSKEFFSNARSRLDEALENLKDEEKAKRR